MSYCLGRAHMTWSQSTVPEVLGHQDLCLFSVHYRWASSSGLLFCWVSDAYSTLVVVVVVVVVVVIVIIYYYYNYCFKSLEINENKMSKFKDNNNNNKK